MLLIAIICMCQLFSNLKVIKASNVFILTGLELKSELVNLTGL